MMNVLAMFSNAFGPDMLVIAFLALLLFGAKKLPELARGLGQSLNEFKKARDDFQHEITHSQTDVTIREAQERQARNVAAGSPTAQDLQRQVEELQAQLRATQQRQQTPQLPEPSELHPVDSVPEKTTTVHPF